jgi:hypothetical protein
MPKGDVVKRGLASFGCMITPFFGRVSKTLSNNELCSVSRILIQDRMTPDLIIKPDLIRADISCFTYMDRCFQSVLFFLDATIITEGYNLAR